MRSMRRTLILISGVLALSSLSACGLVGGLERPAPLFGEAREGLEPAELPTDTGKSTPDLPPRPGEAPGDSDDELLGGPGGL